MAFQSLSTNRTSHIRNILACEDEPKTINLSKFLTIALDISEKENRARVNFEVSACLLVVFFPPSLFRFLEYAYINTSGWSNLYIFKLHYMIYICILFRFIIFNSVSLMNSVCGACVCVYVCVCVCCREACMCVGGVRVCVCISMCVIASVRACVCVCARARARAFQL